MIIEWSTYTYSNHKWSLLENGLCLVVLGVDSDRCFMIYRCFFPFCFFVAGCIKVRVRGPHLQTELLEGIQLCILGLTFACVFSEWWWWWWWCRPHLFGFEVQVFQPRFIDERSTSEEYQIWCGITVYFRGQTVSFFFGNLKPFFKKESQTQVNSTRRFRDGQWFQRVFFKTANVGKVNPG